jgi:hypothetical protein
MQNGIFILDPDYNYKNTVSLNDTKTSASVFTTYPSPAKDELKITIVNQYNVNIHYTITDVLGKVVDANSFGVNEAVFKTIIRTNQLNDGCYYITLQGTNFTETQKIIIQH